MTKDNELVTLVFLFFFIMTAVCLNVSVSIAGDEILPDLTGPKFGDPNQQFDMPEEWIKKPIRYDPPTNADMLVSTDPHLYEAWAPIVKKYAEENNIKIEITRGTCGVTAGRLSKKAVDVGVMCCPPGETDRLPGLKYHTVGIAAIAVTVNPDNPLDGLTIDEARQVFSGDVINWSELSGSKMFHRPVQPIIRLHCKLRPGHWRMLLKDENMFSPSSIEVSVIPDTISNVASDPGAIGYNILWMLRFHNEVGNVKYLKLNGFSPDDFKNLANNNYPLYRVYNFTTWEGGNTANPHAQKLVQYLIQHVENLDGKFGIVPVSQLKQQGWQFKDNELVAEPHK